MSKSTTDQVPLPQWFTPERVDTVIVAFPDVYGRLMGKRVTREHFLRSGGEPGAHVCNYLMTVDVAMTPQGGFKLAGWEQGYGDFRIKVDPTAVRLVPWHEGTAIVVGDMYREDDGLVPEAPRRVLARQIERLAERSMRAYMGSELEFVLFAEDFHTIHTKGYRDLVPSSDYSIDYHILQPGRDEHVLRRIRNEMIAAGIDVECSKGETGRGQHEVNLLYAEAMEMADRHVLYKTGAKDIAAQAGWAITFMSKWSAADAGSSFHIHCSLRDAEGKTNLFCDPAGDARGKTFRQFLGGLLKYSRELAYFFAPTVNSYKRYQSGSWAPTAIVCGHDNRTCGFRIVGRGESLRVENRMPGADGNPYLAFAATIAAGLAGIDEQLDCGRIYEGNAYADDELPRLPETLEEAADLLAASRFARETFGAEVIDFYVHTARLEAQWFHSAVTDWELCRYLEQI